MLRRGRPHATEWPFGIGAAASVVAPILALAASRTVYSAVDERLSSISVRTAHVLTCNNRHCALTEMPAELWPRAPYLLGQVPRAFDGRRGHWICRSIRLDNFFPRSFLFDWRHGDANHEE